MKEYLSAFMRPVTKLPSSWGTGSAAGSLLEGMDEFQAEEAYVASHVLPQYSSKDGGSLAGNKAVRGRGGSRNG